MNHFCRACVACSVMLITSSLSAVDESAIDQRPANVRAAFEAMESLDSPFSELKPEGHMGRKMPVIQAISMFQKRIAERPDDYRSMTILGQLYMRLARETGNHSAYGSAARNLREALAIAPDYMVAKTNLAVSLQAQHRFHEALTLATEAYAANARDSLALATIGDCQLHTGQVSAAALTCEKLVQQVGEVPAVLARQAHVAALVGNSEVAIELLERAREMEHQSGMSPQSVAWYDLRLASLHHVLGHAGEAGIHYQAALELDENLWSAKIGLARLLAERGDEQLASSLLEETVKLNGSARAMVALGDLLTHQGKLEAAATLYDEAETVLLQEMQSSGSVHQRDLSLLYSNRGHKLTDALNLAKQDLLVRADVYAHDTFAWALHRNGMHEQAAAVVQKALQLGTQDAVLHYHAGMIFAANGQSKLAKHQLQKALELNPQFDLLAAQIARQKLTELNTVAES